MIFAAAAYVASRLSADQLPPQAHSPGLNLLIGVLVVVSAVYTVALWRGVLGVQLRPDGLVARGPFGTLTVPWDALAPGYPLPARPAATGLTVAYARPELVGRRGLIRRQRIPVDHVDPLFLGSAIAYYVSHPQHRPAIGTEAEYERLRHTLPGPASS
jgi:hypothetical protein